MQPLTHNSIHSHAAKLPVDQARRALHSWKSIAAELDRGVRTVQRWEQTLGLPIHRISRGPRGPVFAFAEELHCWLRKRANSETSLNATVPTSDEFEVIRSNGKGTSVEGNPAKSRLRRTPKGQTLPPAATFLLVNSCGGLPENCGQCHSPLHIVKALLRISGNDRETGILMVVCKVCNLEMLAGFGAEARVTSYLVVSRRGESESPGVAA
jgi:hypothetical protein